MSYKAPMLLLTSLLLMSFAGATAQETANDAAIQAAIEETHRQLRALKDGAEAAFNKMGESGSTDHLAPLIDYVHDSIVLVAMNGETVIGKDGIRDYFMRTVGGPDPTVASVHHTFDVAALSTLYGDDTAVAHGSSWGRYNLTDGLAFEVDTFWTATMVKEDGRWLLASFQFAPSIFENPLLNKATQMIYIFAAVAGFLGLLLGFWFGRVSGRKATA